MQAFVVGALTEAQLALDQLCKNQEALGAIVNAGRIFAQALQSGQRVFSCGNGGSMCDAMHFAEELSGRYRNDRAPLAATAVSDPSHLSCVANDFGYDEVFSRYVMAHGRSGDAVLAISTSGKSPNVLRAAEVARERGMAVVALTGRSGSALAALADVEICTAGGRFADRVQELHIKVIHILIELIERQLFPEIYLESRS